MPDALRDRGTMDASHITPATPAEEVRTTFVETTDTTHIPVQLRRQPATIERVRPDGAFHAEDPDNHEDDSHDPADHNRLL